MSHAGGVTRQDAAYRRVLALCRGLTSDLEGMRGGRRAGDPVGVSLARVERALAAALGYDLGDDREAVHRRAHARNVVMVLRRTLESWRRPGSDPDLLARAARYADELADTVAWIRLHAPRVETPAPTAAWRATWACRLVSLPARLLPAEVRWEFIEDQCGNLAAARSRREWLGYAVGLLAAVPRLAAAAAGAGRRRPL
jgi:hypothetical protein